MAHFAEIDSNNVVQRVIVVSNSEILDENQNEVEQLGINFCGSLFGGNWVQTSYNQNFRKNFASAGFTYDQARDAFVPPKPFDSWVLNEETCLWEASVAYPDDGNEYYWDEATTSWVLA